MEKLTTTWSRRTPAAGSSEPCGRKCYQRHIPAARARRWRRRRRHSNTGNRFGSRKRCFRARIKSRGSGRRGSMAGPSSSCGLRAAPGTNAAGTAAAESFYAGVNGRPNGCGAILPAWGATWLNPPDEQQFRTNLQFCRWCQSVPTTLHKSECLAITMQVINIASVARWPERRLIKHPKQIIHGTRSCSTGRSTGSAMTTSAPSGRNASPWRRRGEDKPTRHCGW